MYHWSQTSLNQPEASVIVSTTPLVLDQYHPPLTQSQSQSAYHWSQTSLNRPEVSFIVSTTPTTGPRLVLQSQRVYHWSQTSLNQPEVSIIVCTTLTGPRPILH